MTDAETKKAPSAEAVVETNARKTIADLLAGRVGSQTVGDIADATRRTTRDRVATGAINRGMERDR